MMVVLPWRGTDLSVLANGSGISGAVCIFGREIEGGFQGAVRRLISEPRSGTPLYASLARSQIHNKGTRPSAARVARRMRL